MLHLNAAGKVDLLPIHFHPFFVNGRELILKIWKILHTSQTVTVKNIPDIFQTRQARHKKNVKAGTNLEFPMFTKNLSRNTVVQLDKFVP